MDEFCFSDADYSANETGSTNCFAKLPSFGDLNWGDDSSNTSLDLLLPDDRFVVHEYIFPSHTAPSVSFAKFAQLQDLLFAKDEELQVAQQQLSEREEELLMIKKQLQDREEELLAAKLKCIAGHD